MSYGADKAASNTKCTLSPPTPTPSLSLSHILSSSAYHPSVHVYEYQSQSFNAEGLFTWAPSIVVKNSSS